MQGSLTQEGENIVCVALLVLKGIYPYWTYVFFPGAKATNGSVQGIKHFGRG